jgi:hypothetical protein
LGGESRANLSALRERCRTLRLTRPFDVNQSSPSDVFRVGPVSGFRRTSSLTTTNHSSNLLAKKHNSTVIIAIYLISRTRSRRFVLLKIKIRSLRLVYKETYFNPPLELPTYRSKSKFAKPEIYNLIEKFASLNQLQINICNLQRNGGFVQ